MDLEHVVSVMRSNGLEPQVPYPGAGAKWECVHVECGKTVYPAWSHINSGGGPCPYCIGKKVDPEDAIELVRSRGFEPRGPFISVSEKWKLLHHECGKEVRHTQIS